MKNPIIPVAVFTSIVGLVYGQCMFGAAERFVGNPIRCDEIIIPARGCHLWFVSPDVTKAAVVCGNCSIRIYDLKTLKVLHTMEGHEGTVVNLVFSSDGSKLVSYDNSGKTCVWDVSTGTLLRTLVGAAGRRLLLSFSYDGSKLIEIDKGIKQCRIYNLGDGSLFSSFNLDTVPYRVSLSLDGSRLLDLAGDGADHGLVYLRDTKTGQIVDTVSFVDKVSWSGFLHLDYNRGESISPDGSKIAGYGIWRNFWDKIIHGTVMFSIPKRSILCALAASRHYYPGCFNPDGSRYAAINAETDPVVAIWDTETGSKLRKIGLVYPGSGIYFAEHGSIVNLGPSSSRGLHMRVWRDMRVRQRECALLASALCERLGTTDLSATDQVTTDSQMLRDISIRASSVAFDRSCVIS